MPNKKFSRRQILQYLTTMGVLSALPLSVLAQIITKQPPRSPFDDNSTAEEVTEGLNLSGMTFAITGANSGLGLETMRVLTLRGAHVIGIARTQAKAEGNRLSEYMANEYLTIVEMQRRDCEAALDYARNLVDIGERVREGSEKPYAAALQAVCHYSLEDDDAELEVALENLRAADAKQRLAFVLNRTAILHLEKGQLQRAADCAREALEMAGIMDRPSAMLEACLTLEAVHQEAPEIEPESRSAEIAQLAASDVPDWLRQRSTAL